MAETVNWDDPCEKAAALQAAYLRLIQGQQESEVEYQANGVNRRVRYSQANINLLQSELRQATDACAAASGQPAPRRRYAITAGTRRFF